VDQRSAGGCYIANGVEYPGIFCGAVLFEEVTVITAEAQGRREIKAFS